MGRVVGRVIGHWRAARERRRAAAGAFTMEADGFDDHGDEHEAHVPTAASMGLLACPHCDAVWRDAAEGEACGRCGTHLYSRKPYSLSRTWAFLIAACIMYIPANMLPVMITRSLFGVQYDTILSGVIYFWVSGAYGLAAIIFIASFLVPLFKLTALVLLAVLAQRGSPWRRPERAKLYHIVEIIGRWSMLDVFVVALLTGLVQIQGFAVIQAGVGIAAFGSVVVLTMLASLSFDPRLTWDIRKSQQENNGQAAQARRQAASSEDRETRPA